MLGRPHRSNTRRRRVVAGCAAVASALLVGVVSPVVAQTPGIAPFADQKSKGVEISVTYQFFLEGETDTLEEQAKLADMGRRTLYEMLARECEVLLATIATTCGISRATVNSQLQRRGGSEKGVRVSGSATYTIDLKPTKPKD